MDSENHCQALERHLEFVFAFFSPSLNVFVILACVFGLSGSRTVC